MLHFTQTEPADERQHVPPTENLWDVRRLAEYLGYRESSVRAMVSRSADALPPRAPGYKLRWSPDVVKEWVRGATKRTKRGRPRLPL